MALRTLSCLAGLLFSALAAAQDGSSQLEEAIKEKETLTKQIEALKAQLADKANDAPVDLPLSIMNSAGNNVTLANCFESHELQAGEEIATTFLTGGFWVLPDGSDFNCTEGCVDCFYMKMEWSEKDGVSAGIGFGTEDDTKAVATMPEGGGLKLSISGAGSTECTEESCETGWANPLTASAESTISLTIEGSKLEEPAPVNDTVSAARLGRVGRIGRIGGIGRFRRPVFRRPVFRRPIWRRPVWRRPIYRRPIWRRPIWRRPIWRAPIYGVGPTCAWCNQYGRGSCWWLCR